MTINKWQEETHRLAIEKGWYDGTPKTDLECIMLMVSELAEAAEEIRGHDFSAYEVYYKEGKPEGVSVELADCVLRILDFCGSRSIDLENVLKIKHEYNKTRSYKHGKKL